MKIHRDIVVIGASAGGIEAVSSLAGYLPSNLQASLLVVIHTSSQSPRMLADIISRRTSLEVSYGEQGEQIEKGHLYIAPPDHHLRFGVEGFLRLSAEPPEHFHRPAADVLFRSAAGIYGPRVIGIVLSGGDGDGTAGCEAIKRAGGLSIVQDPDEAKDPGMPLSALAGDHPDFRATLDEMGALLIRLVGVGR